MKLAFLGWIAGTLLAATLAGAAPDTGTQASWVAALPAQKISVAAGKPGKVWLRFRVTDGFHINSNQPGSELLIPTTLKLNPPTDVGVGSITYPKGHDFTFTFAAGDKLNVYTGEFAISARVSAARGAMPGRYKVHGELKYQACNDRACYPPRTLPVEFEVTVLKSQIGSGKTRRNPPQSPHIHQ